MVLVYLKNIYCNIINNNSNSKLISVLASEKFTLIL